MWKDFLYYTKTERQGIIVLVVLILGVYAAPKLFSVFTRAEDTDRTGNEKFDKNIMTLFPPCEIQNLTTPPVILFNHSRKRKSNLPYSIRTPRTPPLSFHSDYRPG